MERVVSVLLVVPVSLAKTLSIGRFCLLCRPLPSHFRHVPLKFSSAHPQPPQLPSFLPQLNPTDTPPRPAPPVHADRYALLLDRLRGELGFQEQRTALLWILQQLEASPDLRGLILHLLQQGQAD